ncbi:LysR substrate-binding domain-containing protein [Thalassospira sp.]|uniref:LysR substrate-binding domain-containing protein n=1 Tax=Thalassospira sp. TaxID=1912094 RepID=UPI002736560E|nr:LysR substrate-binding domain-containing protein [Thalassospira sp.]MDP2697088.1 LysR substrate-binding domain-containing protein [Thalassospira sp.]
MSINNRIELRHLRYFICVADELHFGRAAERLGIAQAPLSQQIKQLEERIGVQLLERTTRSVQLTEAGSVFLEKARNAISQVEIGVDAARLVMGQASGKLTIGCVSPVIHICLPQIIRLFRQRCPDTRIDIKILTTNEQLDLMAEHKIDVAFIRPPRTKANLNIEHLFSEGFVGLIPADHPLADKKNITLRDFAGLPYMAYAPILGISYQNVVMQYARRHGINLNITEEIGHTMGIVAMVAAGIGVGIAPNWVTHTPHPDVVYAPMPELPGDSVDLSLAWPINSMSPVVRHFVDAARQFAADTATMTD